MRNESAKHRSVRTESLVVGLAFGFASPAFATPLEDVEFFERKIRPLLIENCFECHADATGTTKGGLALDSRPGWERGGDSGPAIVPGEIEKSLLMRAVKYADPEVHMPPRGKLSETAIRDIETWIAMGAPDPREMLPVEHAPTKPTIDFEAGRRHWAFREVLDVAPPTDLEPRQLAWARDPIDRFVSKRLAEIGVDPAHEIDRKTWLRRVTLDLIGLPPTREEIAAFERDESADAFERVVDRLLASPRHGERFARFWLDLARYSDSNGVDENLAFGHAWRYRDYVVQSMNDDKPFDRFVLEQLAGDLLPEPAGDDEAAAKALREQLVATGFLALGPRMLAEQDKEKLVVDTIDEQIDVVSKTFLAVTIACARCHDHKFDPISQRDYYALAGILRSTTSFDDLGFLSRWRERELASRSQIAARDAWRAEREVAEKALAEVTERGRRERLCQLLNDLPTVVDAVRERSAKVLVVEAEAFESSNLTIDHQNYGTAEVGLIHTHRGGQQFAEYALELPSPGKYALRLRYASGEKRPIRVSCDGAVIAERALDSTTGGFKVEHLRLAEPIAFEAKEARVTLRLERVANEPQHFPHLDRLVVSQPAQTDAAPIDPSIDPSFAEDVSLWLACGGDATLATSAPQVATALAAASDPKAPLPDAALEEIRKRLVSANGPIQSARIEDTTRFEPTLRDERVAKANLLEAIDTRKPPEFDRAMAVADDRPTELPLHIRGSHLNKEATGVARAAPQLFDPLVKMESIAPEASGRLEFARWLVDTRNPLTARVIVNRVWAWHFGFGISRSPSNFGLRGDAPTHPELLDYLANEFKRDGWSLKKLHRRIVLSSTYRSSTYATEEAVARDPENHALSRFPRRRLDAEQLRDSILAVSGALDETMGGTLLRTNDRDYVTNDQSNNGAQYDLPRRTIYLPIIRNAMFDYLSTFDYADPSVPLEQRPQSVVASQALWLMNSPFAIEQALRIARALIDDPTTNATDAALIAGAYSRILLRDPTTNEIERAAEYLSAARDLLATQGAEAAPRALATLCQALFASSEFLHVE